LMLSLFLKAFTANFFNFLEFEVSVKKSAKLFQVSRNIHSSRKVFFRFKSIVYNAEKLLPPENLHRSSLENEFYSKTKKQGRIAFQFSATKIKK
jgi:hypothetical protein